MRLEINLKPLKVLDLPIHYNTHLRGFVYKHLEPKVSDRLHQTGFVSNNKNYKMFTFSRINGKFKTYHCKNKRQKRISFDDTINIGFSSIDLEDIVTSKQKANADTLLSFAERLLSSNELVQINNIDCDVDSVNIKKTPLVDTSLPIKIKMLSPITLHKTFSYTDSSKGTHYYHPFDELWESKLISNLLNKANALGWEVPPEKTKTMRIVPKRVNRDNKVIVNDKGFWIEAWFGEFELVLPEDLFWLAYKAGLGARNSAGFGMFEVLR